MTSENEMTETFICPTTNTFKPIDYNWIGHLVNGQARFSALARQVK